VTETAALDALKLRQVLGKFVTGVTVVTTVDSQGRPYGVTANSFSSVSLDPPLVLWSQATKSPSHAIFREAPYFAINILAEDQIELSNRFAASGTDKYSGLDVDAGVGGVPLLRECSAWIECRVVSVMPGGDHAIYLGRVQRFLHTERRPLVFGGGQYLIADSHDLGAPPSGLGVSMPTQVHAVRLGSRAMARLAREFDQTFALAVWGNHGPTVLAWEPSSRPVNSSLPMGLILPVTSTATGVALAAHLPDTATRRFVGAELAEVGIPNQDWPSTPEAWQQEVRRVRQRGIALRTPGAFHGADVIINAISSPVLDATGQAVFAITAIGDARTFSADPLGALALALKRTCRDVSRRLGHTANEEALA
jgi:flavin reductase (DIM6/NTAB) family NADH-FMN oxidoreductase RutF/DNA-binding IclR family transcriptional regulator